MTITARIERDSIAPSGIRLTTFVLKYPKFIHNELLTHRVFSRNASSSRAIPVKKILEEVQYNPAMPVHWGKNQKGMQAYEEHSDPDKAKEIWLDGLDNAVTIAKRYIDLGIHKQIVNRILEPWMHIDVIVSATDFANFFALRNHHGAQPEIQELAKKMLSLYKQSIPDIVHSGSYHLPFITEDDMSNMFNYLVKDNIYDEGLSDSNEWFELACKVSSARCARISYNNHEGKRPSIEEDLGLYAKLMADTPKHASPPEHQAMAVGDPNIRSGNFRGWVQFRQTIKDHTIYEYKER